VWFRENAGVVVHPVAGHGDWGAFWDDPFSEFEGNVREDASRAVHGSNCHSEIHEISWWLERRDKANLTLGPP